MKLMIRPAVICAVIAIGLWTAAVGAFAQSFTCEDFLNQASAQKNLDTFLHDPYGLDPDGDGIACEEMGGQSLISGSDAQLAEIEAAAYEIVEQDFQQVTRPRVVLRITIDEAGPVATRAAMANAISQALANEPDAMVARVFAYNAGDDTDGGFTRGTAEGSRDGLGWQGQGELSAAFDREPDGQGRAFVRLGSATGELEDDITAVPLDLKEASRPTAQQAQAARTGYTAEETAYVAQINEQTRVLGDSLTSFQELFSAPQIGNDEWTLRIAAVFVTWQVTEDEAIAMMPPASFADAHAAYLSSLSYLNLAGDNFIAGIDAMDPSLIEQGNANLRLATAELNTATTMFEEVAAARSAD